MPIDRIHTRKHARREGRADDHDRRLSLVIERIEIAAGHHGNTKGAEEAGRDGAPHRARIVLAMGVTITRELQPNPEVVGIPPGSDDTESSLGDAG
jgi:hypothetical protein